MKAIYTLFYKQKDSLLHTKTGFDKSLIFQLIPFLLDKFDVVMTLMFLKLSHIEQNEIINWKPQGNKIVLNKKNNNKQVFDKIVQARYTHIFTSLEIILSQRFKNSGLDQIFFTDYIALVAVTEIYLVDKLGNNFWFMYAKIEKICKKIPCYVFLWGVSAILTKNGQS